jgi:hypothetical protein
MNDEHRKPTDLHIVFAYWSVLLLSVIALFLSGFFLLLLLSTESRTAPNIWATVGPFWYAAITWVYLDILSLEMWRPLEQRSTAWIFAALLAGFGSLVLFVVASRGSQHGASIVFLIPFAIGSLSFSAVSRIAFGKYAPSSI